MGASVKEAGQTDGLPEALFRNIGPVPNRNGAALAGNQFHPRTGIIIDAGGIIDVDAKFIDVMGHREEQWSRVEDDSIAKSWWEVSTRVGYGLHGSVRTLRPRLWSRL